MTISKKSVLSVSLFVLLLWGVVLSTFATPPLSPYTVTDNATDPTCAPGSANCYVSSVTADNGLTAVGSNVRLGGTLVQNTTIDTANREFSIKNGEMSFVSGADPLGLTAEVGAPVPGMGFVSDGVSTNGLQSWIFSGKLPNSQGNQLLNVFGNFDLANNKQGGMVVQDLETNLYNSDQFNSSGINVRPTEIGMYTRGRINLTADHEFNLASNSGYLRFNNYYAGRNDTTTTPSYSLGLTERGTNYGSLGAANFYGGYTGASTETYRITIDIAPGSTWTVGSTRNDNNFGSPNNVIFGGAYSGSNFNDYYYLYIESGGTTFNWGDGSGNNGSGVPIVAGTPITLSQGVTVTFGSASYIANENWAAQIDYHGAPSTTFSWNDGSGGSGSGVTIPVGGGSIFLSQGVNVDFSSGIFIGGEEWHMTIEERGVPAGANNFLYTDGSGFLRQAPTSLLGGGSFSLASQDEGTLLTSTTIGYNFIGAGVTATESGGLVTVNIPGGGGSGLTLQTNGVTNVNQSLLNLVAGTNVSLADDGSGNVTINASGGGGGADGSIYLNDGALTGNRTLNGGGNDLTFNNLNKFISIAGSATDNNGALGVVQNQNIGSGMGTGGGFVIQGGYEKLGNTHFTGVFSDLDGSDFPMTEFALLDSRDTGGTGAFNQASLVDIDSDTGISFRFKNSGAINQGYTFPRADGTANQVLTTDGAGQLSWQTPSGGSSLRWYAENATAPITAPVATGAGSIALGSNTYAGSSNMFVFGSNAGQSSTNSQDSNFIGQYAGAFATNAEGSNFIGPNVGYSATNASYSNFFGYNAGFDAVNASNSFFVGRNAGAYNISSSGLGTQNAANSIFIGRNAGYFAADNGLNNTTNANDYSILVGNNTSTGGFENSIALGANATNTASNQFMIGSTTRPINNTIITGTGSFKLPIGTDGQRTGSPASGMIRFSSTNDCYEGYKTSGSAWSCFSTGSAGWSLTGNSGTTAGTNFIGTTDAEDFVIKVNGSEMARFYESTGSSLHSVAFGGGIATDGDMFVYGNDAGLGSVGSGGSIFMGIFAGRNSNAANNSIFMGALAGENSSSTNSIFLGQQAGKDTALSVASNFIGLAAGQGATSASNSNFIGRGAGYNATDASNSNFFGYQAGDGATDASYSNFFGYYAGFDAFDANGSNFLGGAAGQYANNASLSNFIGNYTGAYATNASYSNFIGNYAGVGAANASNSIFIGNEAGNSDPADNTTNPDDFSILLGNYTSTGGFENSIALGQRATNTASNQFMVGSTTRPINETKIIGPLGTECTITTGTGMACTSDQTLKTNILDLSTNTIDNLLKVRTVTYNWLQNPNSPKQIGFLAQNLEQYFPELVTTDSSGKKAVYYSQITPILVEALREMNLKIIDLSDMAKENTWRDALIAWFESSTNGIQKIFTKEVQTDKLCVGQTCVTESQLQQLLQAQNIQNTPQPTSPNPTTPDPLTCTAPQVLNQTGDACVDPIVETPPTDTPPTEEPPTVTE